jgi:hypothetical protein
MMVRDGFRFHQDPEIKKRYRSLAHSHHCGRKQDLHFKSSITGRHTEIKFYEDVVRDHSAGGYFTHDKLNKMPYQLRLKALLAMKKVTRLLVSLGFTDTTRRYPSDDALSAVMMHREEIEDFQGKNFYQREYHSYNATDGDSHRLSDGQIRYFWHYDGSLKRGMVYHHINNMWWVVCNKTFYWNVASSELFQWTPAMRRRKPVSAKHLQGRLDRAIKEQNFEKAIVFRDHTGCPESPSPVRPGDCCSPSACMARVY